MNRFADFPYENREKYHADVIGWVIMLFQNGHLGDGFPVYSQEKSRNFVQIEGTSGLIIRQNRLNDIFLIV